MSINKSGFCNINTCASLSILLFPVDRDTHEFFCRLQNSASLFQTNHVVDWNALREDIFSVWRHDFFVLRDVCLFITCLSSGGKLTGNFASRKPLRICPNHILSSANKQRPCWQLYGRQKPKQVFLLKINITVVGKPTKQAIKHKCMAFRRNTTQA